MMAVERNAFLLDLSLIGHSMDSASNSLRAQIKSASPATFETLTSPVKYFGLLLDDFVYLAPVLRTGYQPFHILVGTIQEGHQYEIL